MNTTSKYVIMFLLYHIILCFSMLFAGFYKISSYR
nr:MAG TPA: hypothetical protein [Caudoviricetes sp.]